MDIDHNRNPSYTNHRLYFVTRKMFKLLLQSCVVNKYYHYTISDNTLILHDDFNEKKEYQVLQEPVPMKDHKILLQAKEEQEMIRERKVNEYALRLNSPEGLTTAHMLDLMEKNKEMIVLLYSHHQATHENIAKHNDFIESCKIALRLRKENPSIVPRFFLDAEVA